MRFRFFNTYEPASTFYRELVPQLISDGHAVEIVISKAQYRLGRNIADSFQNIPGLKIVRVPNLGMHAYKSTLSKGIVQMLYFLLAGLYCLLGPRVDKSIFLTQPPLFYIAGYMQKYLRKYPYICVIMDVQPQEYVEFGLLKRDAFITRLFAKASSAALQNAEKVVVIGRCMAERVAEMGVSREQITFIANWIDERSIVPVEPADNQLRHELNWSGKFVVVYGGNFGLAQYFDDFLEAAGKMQGRHDIVFALMGSGTRFSEIAQLVALKEISNIQMLPFPHEKYDLSSILSAGDLHFISLRESCTGLGVPSKAYGTLAVGRPILYQGSRDGEIARMVEEEAIGTVVTPGDVSGLITTIEKYADYPEIGCLEGKRARQLATGHYSSTNAISKYKLVIVKPSLP